MKTPSGRAYETDVAIPAEGRPMWKHILAGLLIVLCACAAAAGCWRVE